MTVSLLGNVRAVLPDRIAEDATVAYEDGRILAVEEGRAYAGASDGRGAFCLPGLIDTHSDAIEREMNPRPTVVLEAGFALRSLEGRFLAAGVTTAFHGVSFDDHRSAVVRNPEMAAQLVESIRERRSGPAPLRHRILHRVPARSEGSLERTLATIALARVPGELDLLSFEDHTPGQGQFRDLDGFKKLVDRELLPPGVDVDAYVARQIAEAGTRLPIRDRNVGRLRTIAGRGDIRLLAHDCAHERDVALAVGWGAAVAEFPTSLAAASAAREEGLPIVLGAPNVLRGGSHSGNVAGEDLIRLGLCTGLASDYLPASLLAAVFSLAERGVLELPEAVRLVTAGPAEVAGLTDQGRLAPGCVADLALVDIDGRWPTVRSLVHAEDLPGPAREDLANAPLSVSVS